MGRRRAQAGVLLRRGRMECDHRRMDTERHRQLRAAYHERRPDAGVYALRNTVSGVAHVAAT